MKILCLGLFLRKQGMKLQVNSIPLAHSPHAALLFPGPGAHSLPSPVTVFLRLSGHGAPSPGYCPATAPLSIAPGMPEVCALQPGTLGVDLHRLGQRYLGISDISTLDTGLYAYRAPFRTGVSI